MDISKDFKESNGPQIFQTQLISDAEEATKKDHELTIIQAFKLYPKAVAWSAVMSAACIMDGYDLKLIGSLFAQPAFSKAYGNLQPNGTYQITAAWQSGLNNGSNVGQMIGLCFAGYLSERFGFRKTMLATLIVLPCLIFIQFFAPSIVVLEVGQILIGEFSILIISTMIADPYPGNRDTTGHISNHHLCLCC
jgi:SP family general alpha glucoside:H+ symporter-like MFS transporter